MDKLNKKQKVLIAFLGRANYGETTYVIDNTEYLEKLAFMAIYKHFTPIDRTYIIGTKESSWNLLENLSYTPVYIPYGRDEKEFWEIFDIIKDKIDIKNSQVIFDFTHGFRVLPLFVTIFVRLFQYIEPTATLSYLFYGSYEQGQEKTPIVDMSPFIDMLDWIDVVNAFIKYGETDALASKVGSVYNKAFKEGLSKTPKVLGGFYKKLDKISKILHLTYTPLLAPEARELSGIIEKKEMEDESNKFVKPLGLLLQRLRDFTGQFEKETLWKSHLSVARWYAENNRLTQSLLVLRESIITFLCEKDDIDIYDIDKREGIAMRLNESCTKSNDPIFKLWNKVRELRNDVGHAFMKIKGHETTPHRIEKRVKDVIQEAENVLGKGM